MSRVSPGRKCLFPGNGGAQRRLEGPLQPGEDRTGLQLNQRALMQ